MNTLEHISTVSALVHEGLENWARGLLRDAGIETTEVYGTFPPEGTIASHIVLFPYRVGPAEAQISSATQIESLLGSRARNLAREGGIPSVWLDVGSAITEMVSEHFPRRGKNARDRTIPHPNPPVSELPDGIRQWYEKQKDDGTENAWVTVRDGQANARLPSLAWEPPVTIRMQYLVVVGEGARGTADRSGVTAPIAVQTLSVLAAGLQMRRQLTLQIPPAPFDRDIIPFIKGVASVLGGDVAASLKEGVQSLNRKAIVTVTLLPGSNLTNADFTGLMQAMQRPLQPTLHLGVQMALGGAPIFAPGINAEVVPHQIR
jgi:hypothetical protein